MFAGADQGGKAAGGAGSGRVAAGQSGRRPGLGGHAPEDARLVRRAPHGPERRQPGASGAHHDRAVPVLGQFAGIVL